MKDMLPWVVGLAVAYVGWKMWEQYSADKLAGKVWNEAMLESTGLVGGGN